MPLRVNRITVATSCVIGGSSGLAGGDSCLGRRDSHTDQGAVATQFKFNRDRDMAGILLARVLKALLPRDRLTDRISRPAVSSPNPAAFDDISRPPGSNSVGSNWAE